MTNMLAQRGERLANGVACTGVSFESWAELVLGKTSAQTEMLDAKRRYSKPQTPAAQGAAAHVSDSVFKNLEGLRYSGLMTSHSAAGLVGTTTSSASAGASWASLEGVTTLRANAQQVWPEPCAGYTPGLLPSVAFQTIARCSDKSDRTLNAAFDGASAETKATRALADRDRASLVGERICWVNDKGALLNLARVAEHLTDGNYRLEFDAWTNASSAVVDLPVVETTMSVTLVGDNPRAWCLDARPGIIRRGSYCHCGELWTPPSTAVQAGATPIGACNGCRRVRVAHLTALRNMQPKKSSANVHPPPAKRLAPPAKRLAITGSGDSKVGASASLTTGILQAESGSDSDESGSDKDHGPPPLRLATFSLHIDEAQLHNAVAFVAQDLPRCVQKHTLLVTCVAAEQVSY